jgi:hypothetical protein
MATGPDLSSSPAAADAAAAASSAAKKERHIVSWSAEVRVRAGAVLCVSPLRNFVLPAQFLWIGIWDFAPVAICSPFRVGGKEAVSNMFGHSPAKKNMFGHYPLILCWQFRTVKN